MAASMAGIPGQNSLSPRWPERTTQASLVLIVAADQRKPITTSCVLPGVWEQALSCPKETLVAASDP